MDKSGVQQVPEGSRERRKMEETGCSTGIDDDDDVDNNDDEEVKNTK